MCGANNHAKHVDAAHVAGKHSLAVCKCFVEGVGANAELAVRVLKLELMAYLAKA